MKIPASNIMNFNQIIASSAKCASDPFRNCRSCPGGGKVLLCAYEEFKKRVSIGPWSEFFGSTCDNTTSLTVILSAEAFKKMVMNEAEITKLCWSRPLLFHRKQLICWVLQKNKSHKDKNMLDCQCFVLLARMFFLISDTKQNTDSNKTVQEVKQVEKAKASSF